MLTIKDHAMRITAACSTLNTVIRDAMDSDDTLVVDVRVEQLERFANDDSQPRRVLEVTRPRLSVFVYVM